MRHPCGWYRDGKHDSQAGSRPAHWAQDDGPAALPGWGRNRLTTLEVDYFQMTPEAPMDATVMLREFCDAVEHAMSD
jgi:hypothetical protein